MGQNGKYGELKEVQKEKEVWEYIYIYILSKKERLAFCDIILKNC